MGKIELAAFPRDLFIVRRLFNEYADGLGIDLRFQHFDEELAGLSGQYTPPQGCLLLAYHATEVAGCVALRPLVDGDCEMKRLYVRPAYRRAGLGHQLIECVIQFARNAGHNRMLLDTLPAMKEAMRLYAFFGFIEIGPYCFNPIPGARYLALTLGNK